MERRLLLVFVLTFAVLLISQPLLMKYAKQPAPEEKPQPAATQPAPTPTAPQAGTQVKAAAAAAVVAKQAGAESETVIENDLYRITFTNRGAQVKSWVLKKYDDEQGRPLELVNQAAAAQYGYPLSLWTYDENLRKKLAGALYVPSRTGTLKAPAELTFEFGQGTTSVRKTFRFDHSYVIKVDTLVTENGNAVRAFPAWPAGFGDATTPAGYAAQRIDLYTGDVNWHGGEKVMRQAIKNISGGATVSGPFAWAGPVDQYFGAVFLPDDPRNFALITLRNSIEVARDP